MYALAGTADRDAPHLRFGLLSVQQHAQKAICQLGATHLDTIGQRKDPAELAVGDTPMQECALLARFGLLAVDYQLPVFQRDRQILLAKTGYSQRDHISVGLDQFDIEWRITFGPGSRGALDQPLQRFEPQQQRVRGKGEFAHVQALFSATRRPGLRSRSKPGTPLIWGQGGTFARAARGYALAPEAGMLTC